MPDVSVIIPNYNHARFLRRRIESVLGQTFADFELLLLDDASTDGSAEILASFSSDPRVRTMLNALNSGSPFVQWNRGVRAGSGKYVWIAESDDYADPTLLEELVRRLEASPDCGLAYCASRLVDETGRLGGRADEWMAYLHPTRWKLDYENDGRRECADYLSLLNTIPNASAVVFRRSVYESIGGADESMRLAGDWLTWAKMLLATDVAYVAEPLNFYRMHSGNVRSSMKKRGSSALRESLRVTSYIATHAPMSADALERVRDANLRLWMQAVLRGSVRLSEQAEIYSILSQIDPRLNRRLVNKLVGFPAGVLKARRRTRAAYI